MKHNVIKVMVLAFFLLTLITGASCVSAANEGMQIVKKSEKSYMIYLENHTDTSFEFAFSNDKNDDKNTLLYRNSVKDLTEGDACNIAYVDEELYNKYFEKNTYIWARTENGEYIAEGLNVNLKNSLSDEDLILTNTMTKRISADTTQSYTKPVEMKDEVKITKTVGKVVISEEGTTEYVLVKVPESGDIYDFMKLTEKVSNGKVDDDYYSKLEATSELTNLYYKLIPGNKDKKWEKVSNGEVLQPEEAKEGWQYVLWLKNTNGNTVKTDAQFLTCFEDYKPEVISDKIVTKLPVTSDDPTLFIVLGVLVVATIVAVAVRIYIGKKENK